MTTQQIYDRFKGIYKETSTRFFDTTWAVELINDSIDDVESEIAGLNPEFFGTASGFLGAPSTNGGYKVDTQDYELAANFRKVIKVLVKDRGGPPFPHLVQIDYWMKDLYSSFETFGANYLTGGGKGEPVFYYIMQPQTPITPGNEGRSNIGFVPIPTRNGSANGLEIIYHAQRTVLTTIGASIPDLPLDWHTLIPWKMAMNASAIDESPRYGYYQATYQGRLARLLGEGIRGRGEAQEGNEIIDSDW